MTPTQLHAALDAFKNTHPDECSTQEIQDIAEARNNDLSWNVIACVKAALEAAEAAA